jgi:hypothetical protein
MYDLKNAKNSGYMLSCFSSRLLEPAAEGPPAENLKKNYLNCILAIRIALKVKRRT